MASNQIGLACLQWLLVSRRVRGARPPRRPKVTFLRDVAPILNKVGCTSGPCHGAAKGKNGFKLSLRGYDPQFDYEALLYDLSGRRFNRADPARSLMLAKPTQEVPHGGGLRFEIGSDYYKTIYNWIAQGVPFGDPAKDTVRRLEVAPQGDLHEAPGEAADVKVTRDYADGDDARRDRGKRWSRAICPTWRRWPTPSVKGERIGEATLLVRYQGNVRHGAGHGPESEAGLRMEAAAAEQLHRSHDRRQAAAAQDSALAGGGRRRLPAPRVARSHRAAADAGRGARVPGRQPSQDQAQPA